jgi:hypothetical protein
MAQLTFFEQSPPSTLVDLATLTEVCPVEEACSSRRGKPVSLDETGTKIDSHLQIGHNVTVDGYCLLMAQVGPAGGRGIIAIERLVRDGTANPKGEGRE